MPFHTSVHFPQNYRNPSYFGLVKMPPRKRKTVTKTTNVSEETVAEKKAKSSAPVPRVVIEHW